MSADDFKIKSDWTLVFGENLKYAVVMQENTSADTSTKPCPADIVTKERSMHLKSDMSNICKITLEVIPEFSIDWIIIVCDCLKIEKFNGKLEEYEDVVYGVCLEGFDDDVYKYDIDMKTPNTSEICLKFLTLKADLWLFGMAVGVKPVANLIFPIPYIKPSINFENVQSMLSRAALSPNAEKCKAYLQSYMSSNKPSAPPNMSMLMSMMNSNVPLKFPINENQTELKQHCSEDSINDAKLEPIKAYIDQRLAEMESNINKKLDKIIELLSCNTNVN